MFENCQLCNHSYHSHPWGECNKVNCSCITYTTYLKLQQDYVDCGDIETLHKNIFNQKISSK